MAARRAWPLLLSAMSLVLAIVGLVPLLGLVLGPLSFLVAGAALRRLPPGAVRIPALAGRVLSVLVTVLWLAVAVLYGAAAFQLARSG